MYIPNITELKTVSRNFNNKNINYIKEIINYVGNKMSTFAKCGKLRCVVNIPEYVAFYDYIPIDDVITLVADVIRKGGYRCRRITREKILISWEEIDNKTNKEFIKKSKSFLVQNTRTNEKEKQIEYIKNVHLPIIKNPKLNEIYDILNTGIINTAEKTQPSEENPELYFEKIEERKESSRGKKKSRTNNNNNNNNNQKKKKSMITTTKKNRNIIYKNTLVV